MEQEYQEVYFEQFCKTCKHEETYECDDPCNECLENPYNLYSHKPVKWEPKK